MNIFCNDSGKILSVNPEPIYQNSAGVNIIRFIGQFPTSAQVLMAYQLPNGDLTMPKMLAFVQEVEVAKVDGGKFGVWEGRIGATPKIDTETGQVVKDENGQVVYDLDYTITQYSGTATVQFYVYAKNGGQLATASTNFVIEKGVPMDLPDISNPDNAELLEQILSVVANTQELYGNVETELEALNTSVSANTADIETLKSEIENTIPITEKGQPNGVASLNAQGKVPETQLPSLDYLPLAGGVIDGNLSVYGKLRVDGPGNESGVSPNTTAITSIFRDGLKLDVIIPDSPNYWYDYTLYSHSGIYQKVRNNVYKQKLPQGNGTLALQEPIDTQLAVINQALSQSGIMYTADNTASWDDRITADGANVLDGSKAILKKVVGNTVKCENLIPFPYGIASGTTVNGITINYDEYGVITLSGKNGSSDVNINLTDYIGKYRKLKAGTYKYSQNVGYNVCSIRIAVRSAGNDFLKNITIYHEAVSQFTISQEDEENGYQYGFNIVIVANADVTGVVFKPMLNEGSTALPYQPYFTGLKSASFAGIESTGRNLINQDLLLEGAGASRAVFEGFDCIKLTAGTTIIPFSCKANANVKLSVDVAWENGVDTYYFFQYADGTISKNSLLSLSTTGDSGFRHHSPPIVVPEKDVVGISVRRYGNYILYIKDLMLNNGTTELPYEPYIEPSVFNFPETEELGKWDEIDFENQKVVKATETIVFNGTEDWTEYTSSGGIKSFQFVFTKRGAAYTCVSNFYNKRKEANFELKSGECQNGARVVIFHDDNYTTVEAWKAHLAELYASGNPLTVAYELETPTETPFTAQQSASGNEYIAKKGGTERVLGNDNAEYLANNELTINYVYITEVQ